MATISVTNASQLNAALASGVAGDIISCAPGSYGALNCSRVMAVGGLTITSADQTEANRAKFGLVDISNSDRITLSYLYFDYVRGATPIFTPTLAGTDAKRSRILFNIFDGDYGPEGCGWGSAIQLYGNSMGACTDHIIQGNIFRKYAYGIQMNIASFITIQGNRSYDISNDHEQFAQVEDVDVIHNYKTDSRLPVGSSAHPDAGQTFTTGTSVPSKRVRRLRNICDFSVGSFTEGFFANNEVFNGGNSGFRYEDFEYRDNWMKCNHLECITLHGGDGLIIEGNQIIATPVDASDPFNAAILPGFGGVNANVWVPRINVLNTIGVVSVQNNRFWGAPLHSASRLTFTGSTAGFVVANNLLDKDASGPAMPVFTLGGDGLGGAVGTVTKTTAGRVLHGTGRNIRQRLI